MSRSRSRRRRRHGRLASGTIGSHLEDHYPEGVNFLRRAVLIATAAAFQVRWAGVASRACQSRAHGALHLEDEAAAADRNGTTARKLNTALEELQKSQSRKQKASSAHPVRHLRRRCCWRPGRPWPGRPLRLSLRFRSREAWPAAEDEWTLRCCAKRPPPHTHPHTDTPHPHPPTPTNTHPHTPTHTSTHTNRRVAR